MRSFARSSYPAIDSAVALALTHEAARSASHRRRRRIWLMPTALIAVSLLAIPTAAVAERIFEAQSGEFSEETTESEAGNEWIYTGSPDYESYLLSIVPKHLPAPEWLDWDAEAKVAAKWYQSYEGGYIEDATLICDFENTLWQAWIAEWIMADHENDDVRREAAMAALREAPSWPNIASSDGGGIRYSMWAFVARMNVADPQARRVAAQALAERETGQIARVDQLIELDLTDALPADEQLATRGPAFHKLYEVWDHRDRQLLITEILAGIDTVSSEDDSSAGSPYWDDYDRALVNIATAAGVKDPAAAVGHSRLGPSMWKDEPVWKGEQSEGGDVK
ncbi:hypothetical protein G7066_06205 [Leucobacter coleopterorum]|uniref:HEAT repeat-containing protein n=1 Tax=Leucobacter coleopterorum TaxID=2714933 RepID=A0ABX6JVK8_9MICO|nr:hypothetical protein [Leucobacter coleopterorum]QIM18341.1 hypothetical protein G7066_06205 [Leucobacter coleopterorum]